MKAELREEYDEKLEKQCTTIEKTLEMEMDKKLEKHHIKALQRLEFVSLQSQNASQRSIEDWCLDHMRQIMYNYTNLNHGELVEQFLQNYILLAVETCHLVSLKNSMTRKNAVHTIHVDSEDEQILVKIMWISLKN